MSGNNNKDINAAYIAFWKSKNPKLNDIETNGKVLTYHNEKINITDIYMQDILRNPNIFYSIDTMESKTLVDIIKVHIFAILLKEKELEEKVRRYQEYEYK